MSGLQDIAIEDLDLSLLTDEERRELDVLLAQEPVDLLATLSEPMRAFVLDQARMKAAQCTRRAGKSYSAALDAVLACLETPGVVCCIIGKTFDSTKKIFWKPILKKIDQLSRLGCEFNGSSLEMSFPNGSSIHLAAADANEQQKAKLYGQRFKVVVIDESEAFDCDLRELVEDVLGPAMVDWEGDITLCGMPCNRTGGFFFDVTTGARDEHGKTKHPGWSVHKWSALQNPFVSRQFQAEIDRKVTLDPDVVKSPGFRQMWLNEWVVDLDSLCYRMGPQNDVSAMPNPGHGRWHHVLGVDLGFDDDTALVVTAYHDHLPELYVLDAWKSPGLDITAAAEAIKRTMGKHPIERTIIDGANKQAVQELQNRHGLSLTCSDKAGKSDFIDLLNGDLRKGSVKLLPSAAPLATEWATLVWDARRLKAGIREEDPKCANHLADAFLYAWRMSYHSFQRPEPVLAPDPRTWEGMLAERERMRARVEASKSGERFPEPIEPDWSLE